MLYASEEAGFPFSSQMLYIKQKTLTCSGPPSRLAPTTALDGEVKYTTYVCPGKNRAKLLIKEY